MGIGEDTHRLAPGGPLRLGGVDISHDRQAVGHSDADVLLHAVIDALLGAVALGDIGELFPDTDPVNRDRDSAEMLREGWQRVRDLGYRIVNLDCIVQTQQPRLTPHKEAMRRNLAELLAITVGQVAIKAKTGEGVGPVGRGEAIEARCVVLLEKDHPPETLKIQPAMTISVYNTLSRTKEPFRPVVTGRVGIYLCGPTVYKPSHIGHMVGPVIFDTIKRYLVHSGYDVTWVVNITDVDDKLIAESKRRGIPMAEVAREMTEDYLENLKALGVEGIDHFPKATDNMEGIVALIEDLINKGFAYASEGDVYFDVTKDSEYGKLSRRGVDQVEGEGGNDRKRHGADFALWKRAKPDEPSWPSPWGLGRPGWHIECSAMSRALLGETFDIHGGGLDLVFPHHENEIAQSECCHGKPMARYWMHNGLMQASSETGKVGGRATRAVGDEDDDQQAAAKISKSTGALPFRELLERHAPETIRFFLLTTHYRRPIDFSDQRIDEVRSGIDAFYRFFKRFERITGTSFYELPPARTREQGQFTAGEDRTLARLVEHRARLLEAMDDDFNTGAAIGELFELVRTLNKACDQQGLDGGGNHPPDRLAPLLQGAKLMRELTTVLGLFQRPVDERAATDETLVGQLIELLIDLRASARKQKDFATADRIRDGLAELKITLEDRPGGTDWSLE
ncbi:MAG: cysteine--tRNA ligase [Pirellulales bacterium]